MNHNNRREQRASSTGDDAAEAGRASVFTDPKGSRRQWLGAACAVAAGLGLPTGAAAVANGKPQPTGTGTERVDLSCRVSASRLDALVAAAFKLFNQPVVLPDFDAAKHGARHDVDLHRLVTTVTVPETGEKLTVSGLLALPVGVEGPLPVVCWQHGTILSFDQVPSNLLLLRDAAYQTTDSKDSLETLLNVQRFAGQGYAVIAADYVGKGPFRHGRGEGYAVKDVTVQTCLAMLDTGMAVMKAMKRRPGALFLNGWSQGALKTQWLHQALRRQSRPIAATAVESPFNDLTEAWRFWAGAQEFPVPPGTASYPALPDWISLCMIVTLGSYQLHYRLDGLFESAIRPEFHGLARRYWSDYAPNFDPTQPLPSGRTFLVPGFLDRFTDERNSAFIRRMAGNSATWWHYDEPIRFHFGLADEAIHPTMAGRALAAGGGKTTGVPIAGASHRGTFLAALFGDASTLAGRENVVDWFDSLRK